MKALDMLTKARMQGLKPSVVMVEVGGTWQRDWWKVKAPVITLAIPDDVPMRTFDARALVGCAVVVIPMHDNADRLRDVVARLIAHASTVQVLRLDGRKLAGNVWDRGSGWRALREVA